MSLHTLTAINQSVHISVKVSLSNADLTQSGDTTSAAAMASIPSICDQAGHEREHLNACLLEIFILWQ